MKIPTSGVTSLYVFCHDDGKRLVNMEKGLKGAARRAEVEDLRWHDLRRTAACRWLQRDGRRMEEVRDLLGHSSVAVTESRYAFLENEKVAGEIAQIPHIGQRNVVKLSGETKG
jgi:integrase